MRVKHRPTVCLGLMWEMGGFDGQSVSQMITFTLCNNQQMKEHMRELNTHSLPPTAWEMAALLLVFKVLSVTHCAELVVILTHISS